MVTLTTNPGSAGFAATYYALDNAACSATNLSACQVYRFPFAVSTSGLHLLTFFSLDGLGIGEAVQTQTFAVDPTSASVSAAIIGIGTNLSVGTGGSTPVSVSGSGSGAVGAAVYGADPAGPATFNSSGAYSDVAVAGIFTGLTITDCDLNGGTEVYWWNGTAWALASDQTYNATTKCVTITVNSATAPNLTQLGDTPFGAGSPPATTTAVTSSAASNPSVFGQPVTFTATVSTGAAPGTPTGTVGFYIDPPAGATCTSGLPASATGTGTLSGTSPYVATYQTSSLGSGSQTILACYPGDASFAASSGTLSLTVLQAQAISFTSTPPSPALVGGSYPVSATGGGSTSPVTFTIDASYTTGACSLSDATVRFTAVGSCIVDANQAGGAGYAAAPQAQQPITITNALTPAPLSQPLTGTATVALSPTLGGFTDPNSAAVASAFTARVTWGDGSPATAGSVTGAAGSFSVSGSHTYTLDGSYSISVSVSGDGAPAITLAATAKIGEPAGWISVTGAMLSGSSYVEGSPLSVATVATFTDKGAVPANGAAGYSATIDWGDGSTPTTAVIGGAAGSYTVSGTHTYAEEGKYATSVQVAKVNVAGGTGNGSGSITVADADKLTATAAAPLSASVGTALSNTTLATFTDTYTGHSDASDFTASINWGDGTPAAAGTVSGSGGSFSVAGSHTYQTKGAYSIAVTLSDKEPASDPTLPVASATTTDSVTVLAAGGSSACSGTNLSYCHLTGQALAGKNLSGVNLTGSDLQGVSLAGTNLKGATLSGANLTGDSLQGANLMGMTAENATLQGANLSGVDLQSADLKGANLSGANLQGSNLQSAVLTSANLANANLQGANLANANGTGANLQGANLTGANTQGFQH